MLSILKYCIISFREHSTSLIAFWDLKPHAYHNSILWSMGDDKDSLISHTYSASFTFLCGAAVILVSRDVRGSIWILVIPFSHSVQPALDRSLSIKYAKRHVTWSKSNILGQRQTASSPWHLLFLVKLRTGLSVALTRVYHPDICNENTLLFTVSVTSWWT